VSGGGDGFDGIFAGQKEGSVDLECWLENSGDGLAGRGVEGFEGFHFGGLVEKKRGGRGWQGRGKKQSYEAKLRKSESSRVAQRKLRKEA
jgi:hypothetical protein